MMKNCESTPFKAFIVSENDEKKLSINLFWILLITKIIVLCI